MLSKYSKVVTYSKGMMNNRALRSFWGDKLCYGSGNLGDSPCFVGWGNKPNTVKATRAAARHGAPFFRLEDGFIRSVGLGVEGAASFSLVVDDLGIYYDATKPSRLEKILQEYDFAGDSPLMTTATSAIGLIKRLQISKYNGTRKQADQEIPCSDRRKVLVISQTAGDMSLKFGYGEEFSTNEIVDLAVRENPGAEVYLKIHPDVLAGKKPSDLDRSRLPKECRVITRTVNPIALLERIDRVYTKTSQMGFEALLLGKECTCFGMPFYAGWGLTDDRVNCRRRQRSLTATEIFAGAYLLYSRYYNPCLDGASDIFDTLYTIDKYRAMDIANASLLVLYGFPVQQRRELRRFFRSNRPNRLVFCNSPQEVASLAGEKTSTEAMRVHVWGSPAGRELDALIGREGRAVSYVEEGLLRDLGSLSALATSCSLVVDSRGSYLDPSRESDLEHIFNTYDFAKHTGLLSRAGRLIDIFTASRAADRPESSGWRRALLADRGERTPIILIPGQAANHPALRQGGLGMTVGQLVEAVRAAHPQAYLIYQPPPAVPDGGGTSAGDEASIHNCCDLIASELDPGRGIACADEIHTISSGIGFSALLSDRKVVTYGLPFYANWGLTEDRRRCPRRTRVLTKEELVAGALLVYPRYLHPRTGELCEIEPTLAGDRRRQDRLHRSAARRLAGTIGQHTATVLDRLFGKGR